MGLHMILPVGCLLVIVLAYFIAKKCCVKKNDIEKQENMKETASKAVILIILLIFPGLATKIFTIFKCKTIEGIPGSLLVEDYDQRCYEGEHFTFMIIGVVFLCLYVLGIPLIMFLLLWRNKKHLHDEKSPKHRIIKNALGGMYTQYEPSYWWFEILLIMDGKIEGPKQTFNSEALAYILIAISVLCIASQIGITIFVDCGVWERCCGKKKKNDEDLNKSYKTKVQPIEDKLSGSDEKEIETEQQKERENLREWRSGSISAAASKSRNTVTTQGKVIPNVITQL